MKFDTTGLIGLVLFLSIWGGFFVVAALQYLQATGDTERLVTLNLRTALFLPFYALFLFAAVIKPSALPGLNILITFFEGYSFYSFYILVIYNLGGPFKAIEAFAQSDKQYSCCRSRCPTDPETFYRRTIKSLFHFMVTRSILMIAGMICAYGAKNPFLGRALTALFNAASTIILVIALLHIILFYEKVYESSSNLFGLSKAFLLKFSVTLIVFQGLPLQFLEAFGGDPYGDDSTYSANDKTIRGYAVLILIEFAALLPFYIYSFGVYKIVPTENTSTKVSPEGEPPARSNFFVFFRDIFRVLDLAGYLVEPIPEFFPSRGGHNKIVAVASEETADVKTP